MRRSSNSVGFLNTKRCSCIVSRNLQLLYLFEYLSLSQFHSFLMTSSLSTNPSLRKSIMSLVVMGT